jgi:diadenosine tetraphosphate (Ap4A) HIT family hydrolase
MDKEKCSICKKHKDNIRTVFQNDILYVSHYIPHPDKDDNYLGYYFVETKRHFKGMYDATDEEMSAIGIMQKNISKALMTVPNIEHVYSFIIGDNVDHFHIHIIGRYKNAPREYFGPRVDDWPEAPRGKINEIAKLDEQIRSQLNILYATI